MKYFLTIFSLFLCSTCIFGQAFEGKIVYTNSYVSKTKNLSAAELSKLFGARYEYYIKGANYKSVSDGNLEFMLYVPAENRVYMKLRDQESVTSIDAGANASKVLKKVINRKVEKILGFECDEVILTTEQGSTKYYFNAEFSVDKRLFEKHAFGNWYELVSVTNSLPLKSIVETPQYIATSEAVEIKRIKLTTKDFVLPKSQY